MLLNGSEKKFPLSLSQLNILNLERVLTGTSVNNISTTVRIVGRLDFPVLQQSINLVIERDPSLRTRLVDDNGTVLQYHASFEKQAFPVYDFSNTSKEGIENWENAVTRELIPLFGGPLYRFVLFRDSENSGGVLVKLHHIIADGWSQIMLCNKIGRTYLDLLMGKEPDLPVSPDYELHVREEQEYLTSKAYKKDEAYWKNIVSRSEEPSVLKSVSSSAVSAVGRRLSFDLPEILNHAIYTYCLKNRIAPFAVFYMALAIYFKRNGGADKFTIGVPVFNRTNYEFKQSTGMFVTTLPFYNEIDDEWSFDRFNEALGERWLDMLRHQRYPFSHICELAARDGRLFNLALSYQDSKIFESPDASVMFSGRWHYCGYQAEQLTIHLTNLKNNCSYAVDYDYLAQLFTEAEIAALHKNLCHILSEALNEPDRPIYRLNILSLEQKEELLYQFNRTDRFLEERSVYRALLDNNTRYLNRVALIHNGERMTYGTLFHHGTQLASALVAKGIEDGLVAVLLPRGFELFSAMVGTVQINCAYMLLSESLPTDRIRNILIQSGACAVITDTKGAVRLDGCQLPLLCVDGLDTAFPCVISEKCAGADSVPHPGDALAYVVYTSGSTGEPKGVEITQRNLLNLAQEMETVYGQGAVLSVSNIGFDAFMLESIVALLNGRTVVLPSDSDLESPETLASLMNSYAVDFFSMTPSRLSAFMQSNAFRKVMWRMESIVCGGEPFPPELLKKLKNCTKARIYNQYGPSETTVAVSMKEISRSDRITIGTPMGNCKLYILDQWMNPLPIGGNGRLFVGGKCVGRGYRNRSDLTEKSFHDNPFINDDRIYDTGDMAYWMPNGEIVLTGRADRQLKLNGLRIEPQEISACIETYPGITRAYACVCKVGDNKILGAYYTADADISETELLSHTATYLPNYMIPAFVIRVEQFTTTANGKIDESVLPLPQTAASAAAVVNSSPTAHRVTEIFREVLSSDDLNEGSDYFLSGGNSLNALETVVKIEEAFGMKIRVSDLYACRCAARIADLIDGTAHTTVIESRPTSPAVSALKKAPKRAYYPLTAIQQGIYIQSQFDPNGLSYNMPGAFLLEKAPDVGMLSAAFRKLIADDAVFRTAFVPSADGVRAVVRDHAAFALETIAAEDFDSAAAQFLKPFDLSAAPLLRAALWTSSDEHTYLFVDSHHIIGDGMSTSILLKRLDLAYKGTDHTVDWDYYDYVDAEAAADAQEKDRALSYWLQTLKDLPEVLDLPTDHARQKRFDYRGAEIECCLNDTDSRKIKCFCQEHGYSEYAVFLSAYGLLLSAVSGRDDMIIGTPVAGRTRSEYAHICGPFINTLPIRLIINRNGTVGDLLKSVQQAVAQMIDHQNVSLEEIISAIGLDRGEQNALYRVMMSHSPVDTDTFTLGGDKMHLQTLSTNTAKMDLVLELINHGDQFKLRLSYAASLFDRETAAFYSRCIEYIAKELVKNCDKTVDSISAWSPIDKERMVDLPNFKVTPFVNRPLHRLIKSRSLTSADEVAIIYHDEPITYSRLEKRAAAIARFVENEGILPGQCVGICLDRTPDLIAAMYGVLKAGCAYMLLNPGFPAERIRYMLEISNTQLLLCTSVPDSLSEAEVSCRIRRLSDGEADEYVDRPVSDFGLFNVHFTSGSTGKPKGVKICHRSMANLYAMFKDLVEPYEGNVLCSTQTVFDCFVVETLVAIAAGRTVILADSEEMMLPWKLARLMETYNTGIFEMTPSRLSLYFKNEDFCRAAQKINLLMVGGEVLNKSLLDEFYRHSSGTLLNMYGPSEATVYTTMGIIPKDGHITIGSQVMNTRVYVVDENLRPVIPTAVGELCVAGEGLSSGYISAPALTEKSFVDDVLSPGSKMYRSGDLVRLRTDGTFDYIGRKDSQVKLNGQRVELSEITCAIEQTSKIKQAAVVAVQNEDGAMQLYAFYSSVDGEDITEEIRTCTAKVLPDYMVPSVIIQLDEFPSTATGKIDSGKLREMAQTNTFPVSAQAQAPQEGAALSDNGSAAYEVPETDYVLSVWNRVLSTPVSDPHAEFFKSGGTSMAALSVLGHYYSDGLEMALSEFYENVTAQAQAELLSKKKTACPESVTADAAESDGETPRYPLVTGATGFFGIHLVKELIDSGCDQVICLMRDPTPERMRSLLVWYFGEEEADRLLCCIDLVRANIAEPQLGMSDAQYDSLVSSVGEVYHAAADVRHYAADEASYMKTNVDGTRHMLALCRRAGAAFYHMSTLSVSGNGMKPGYVLRRFTETDYDIGQIWEDNIYIKSKFLAEGLVFDAGKEGMNVKIFRLGRLLGRMKDGKFQRNADTNVFYLLLKGIAQIGIIPQEIADIKTDVMPIDLSVKEVLALRSGESTVYHIMNFDPPTLREVLQAAIGDITAADPASFEKTLRAKLPSMDPQLAALVIGKLQEESSGVPKAQPTFELTETHLAKAGFGIPPISLEIVFKNFCKGE